MQPFNKIYKRASARCDGDDALLGSLPLARTKKQLLRLSDADCLDNMSRRIFQAGLNRKMIDNKWPAFKAVFNQFDIHFCRMMSDEDLQLLMQDQRIVRHWGKIQSVRHNAQSIQELNEEQGSFVRYLADWPENNIIDLWHLLKKRFRQLGGASGSYFLRRIKKDTFLLTDDVIRALMYWGAVDYVPKNRQQLKHVQTCMNRWHAQSEFSYCQISMILALSID